MIWLNNGEERYELLIRRAKKGNMEAFESLVRINENRIYNICIRMLCNEEDALDASQDTFIKAYNNISKFDERSKFSTWLYRIAVNTCLDMLRKIKKMKLKSIYEEKEDSYSMAERMPSKEGNPESLAIEKEKRETVLKAMDKLSEEYKTAIVLRDLQGLSYIEIAEITDTTLGTVKSRIARGRKNLRDILISSGEINFERRGF